MELPDRLKILYRLGNCSIAIAREVRSALNSDLTSMYVSGALYQLLSSSGYSPEQEQNILRGLAPLSGYNFQRVRVEQYN